MEKNRNRLFYKSFFIMLLTIALQNVIVYSVNLADNIMLGRYSELSMSGTALVNQIQFLLQMLIGGAGEGITVIASRHWGEKDITSIKKVASVGMKWGLAFGGVLFAITFFFPEHVLRIFTNQPDLVTEAAKYLRIISFSYPVFAITNIIIATLRSVETVRIGFIISVVTLVSNISLNYILIFGKLSFPELGIEGAAIATLISRSIELVIALVYLLFVDKKIKIKAEDYFRRYSDMSKRFLKTGIPVILSGGSWGIAMGVQTAILGRMAAPVIAANSIAATVFSIVTVFIYGSANAASVVLGKRIGENKAERHHEKNKAGFKDDIKKKSYALQIIFLVLGILSSALLFVLKAPIISVYEVSEETRILADRFISILCITVIGTAYQMPALSGIIRSGGNTSFVFRNDLIFMWGLVLPSSFIAAFALDLSPVIVFICLKSDQILKCAVAAVKVNRFRWIIDI